MKSIKIAGFYKLVAFALIAIMLVVAAQVAASGWQSPDTDKPDSGEVDDNNNQADENTDGKDDENQGANPNEEPPVEEIVVPKYYNYLTGLETTDEASRAAPICFVLNSSSPLYSISSADVLIEIPVENGETRLLAYVPSGDIIGKIGSVAATRPYISSAAKFFGGIAVYSGNDGGASDFFPAFETHAKAIDLSQYTGYCYTENTLFLYTNSDLINAGLLNASLSTTMSETPTLPFNFTAPDGASVTLDKSATTVVLPYSPSNETELYYSKDTGLYTFCKSGSAKKDLLNAKNAEFTNAFILFANSKLHYTEVGTSFEMNTEGGGRGYYLSGGQYTEIIWSVDESGNMIFSDTNGTKLTVNRGKTYIGYFISSNYSTVGFVQ